MSSARPQVHGCVEMEPGGPVKITMWRQAVPPEDELMLTMSLQPQLATDLSEAITDVIAGRPQPVWSALRTRRPLDVAAAAALLALYTLLVLLIGMALA